jgi:polysaccharide biosynthesis transport protein
MNQLVEPKSALGQLPAGSEPGRQYPQVYPAIPEAGDPSGSGAVADYWQIIRRRKTALFLIVCLGVAAALLVTLPQRPVYQAAATLEVLPVNQNFLNMRDVNPTAAEPSYTPEYDIQTQVNVLQSHSTLEGALGRIHLSARVLPPELRPSPLEKALGRPAKLESKEELALSAAQRNLRVRARPNTRLVEIRYDSSDPAYAADFVNALAAETIERNLQTRWEAAQHTSDWLTRQMEDLKRKLEQSEEGLQAYARSVGLAFMGEKDNLAEQKLRQVQEELSRAQADRISKQSRYELAANASVEALPEVLDDTGLKDYRAKLTDLRRQLAELSSSYTGAFPKIKKLQAEIAELQSARDAARGNVVARIRNEYDAAQRRERLLIADYEKQLKLVSSQSAAVSRYNILKGEADTERQLYESMVQRVKEAGLASALRASNIQVVDAAQPPRHPYKPNILLNMALGLLSALFFGIGYLVVREHSDRRIREPGDTPVYLEASELGVIPSAKSDRYSDRKRLPQTLGLSSPLHGHAVVPNHPEVKFWTREPSALAESFRAILTSLLFASHNGHRPRVLVLSSPNPGEGKTLVTSNLAIALARANMRVLVIDGDLRKPRLHDIFGVENDNGFSDVLLCADTQLPILSLRETSVPGLLVLCSGTCADTDLLYSKRLPGLIAQLRREFDMILIDTPPMLHMPDARILARHADAVVLVLRSRQTTKDAALIARQRLAEDGTRVLGTILNDWDPTHSSAYGYEKYYDHYRRYRQAKA